MMHLERESVATKFSANEALITFYKRKFAQGNVYIDVLAYSTAKHLTLLAAGHLSGFFSIIEQRH